MTKVSKEDVSSLATSVQALSVVVWDTAALQGDNLPSTVRMSLCHGAPKSHIEADVAFISNGYRALVSRFAVFHVDGVDLANFKNHSNNINSMRLNQLFNSVKTGKSKTIALNFIILCTFFTDRVLRESQAEIVLDWSESLVGELYTAIAESIDTIILKDFIHLDGSFVESSALDHSTILVNKVKVEQLTIRLGIFPFSDGLFFNNTRLNRPVVSELI